MKTRACFFSCLMSFLGFSSCHSSNWTDLTPDEFEKAYIAEGIVTIDVRTADEFAAGHLYHAINIDWQKEGFMDEITNNFNKDITLAIYCRSGRRSAAAAQALSDAGYKVLNMTGGYTAWAEAGKMSNTYQMEYFPAVDGNDPLVITLIKHGSLELSYKGISIQIDPVSGYGKNTDYSKEFPKADVILVTHEHGDHLDKNAINALVADLLIDRNHTMLLLNAKSQTQLGMGDTISNGQRRILPRHIVLDAVPAYNTTSGREQFHPKGNGNGYVLQFPGGLKIYVAGDTEDVPEMSELKDIDVAFLPVNQPYTMTVEQCVKAANVIKPKVLIPYHFSQTDLKELPSLLPDIDVRIRNMQ
ncbi:MAG: MBL fold metallo-hydrolase [Bacteroidaceae bacterium]|nr:MBL fold metallo-hydrolase [Bacteroidaceae bacterium]